MSKIGKWYFLLACKLPYNFVMRYRPVQFNSQGGSTLSKLNVAVIEQSGLKARGYFYAGGTYKGDPGKRHMVGQMFVEVYVPKMIRSPYPMILFHGAGQTNVNWLGTPDGRMGLSLIHI